MEINQNIPNEYKVLSPWAYFGYSLLFAIPLVGLILAIVFAFDNTNLNRRNYARSYFCGLILVAIMVVLFIVFGAGLFATYTTIAHSAI